MNYKLRIRKLFLLLIIIFVIGGIGGVVFERSILPYLSTISFLKRFSFLNPQTPIVITKREEIRINEGVNFAEVANRVKNALVTVYFHEGEFGSKNYHFTGVMSGLVVTSDGIIVIPAVNLRPETEITVVLFNQEIFQAYIVATDSLTSLTFLKIEAKDLPIASQGTSQELQVGERLLVVKATQAPLQVQVMPLTVSSPGFFLPSLAEFKEFNQLNAFLGTDFVFDEKRQGAVVVNKDAAIVGFVTQMGKEIVTLRSEDLKLALNNFLDDQKIVWPNLKVTYQILGESQTKLLGLPKKNGILIKSASLPLRENDFVYAVNGQGLSLREGFQQLMLAKKTGEKVELGIIRAGQEMNIEITL